jgi:hypothetical protein
MSRTQSRRDSSTIDDGSEHVEDAVVKNAMRGQTRGGKVNASFKLLCALLLVGSTATIGSMTYMYCRDSEVDKFEKQVRCESLSRYDDGMNIDFCVFSII